MKYIGGYSILDLTDANVSAQANACYNQDKPVLVYGANGERYFADTITKSGTSIIITKGGKTITIANDNTITNVGDIQVLAHHLYEYLINITYSNTNEDIQGGYCKVLSNENFDTITLDSFKTLMDNRKLVLNGYVNSIASDLTDGDNTLPLIVELDNNNIQIRNIADNDPVSYTDLSFALIYKYTLI